MNSNKQNTSGSDISRLVDRLKTQDSNYATLSRGIQVFYWIFIPLNMVLGVRHYLDSGDVIHLISSVFMVLAFLIFALFFGRYYREYKNVDYSQPTLIMLKKAAYRYKPFQLRTAWVGVALVLMDIGLTINQEGIGMMIGIQYMFWGGIFLGLIAGLFIWYIKYKPLRDDALRLISEIEGG